MADETRDYVELHDRTIDSVPDKTWRIAYGAPGQDTLNMTIQDFYDNISVSVLYDWKYLSKTNVSPYTPTEDYHPATKKYVDDNQPSFELGGVVDNTKKQGWTELAGGMRLQWFMFTSNQDDPQTVPFPYPFPTAAVNITLSTNMQYYDDDSLVLTKDNFTIDRDNALSGDKRVYVQVIGY